MHFTTVFLFVAFVAVTVYGNVLHSSPSKQKLSNLQSMLEADSHHYLVKRYASESRSIHKSDQHRMEKRTVIMPNGSYNYSNSNGQFVQVGPRPGFGKKYFYYFPL